MWFVRRFVVIWIVFATITGGALRLGTRFTMPSVAYVGVGNVQLFDTRTGFHVTVIENLNFQDRMIHWVDHDHLMITDLPHS